MRKQRAAARGLPFQAFAERLHLDSKQHEIALSGKMLRCRLNRLFGRGEMNVAVAQIDLGAVEDSVAGLIPEGEREIL